MRNQTDRKFLRFFLFLVAFAQTIPIKLHLFCIYSYKKPIFEALLFFSQILIMKKYFLLYFLSLTMCFSLFAQTAGDYRSATSGNWNVAATWETYNGTAWVAAALPPDFNNGLIDILAGHTINVLTTVTTDETTVNIGGTLNVVLGGLLEVNDGVTANDLIVSGLMNINGTLRKNQGANVSSTMATLSINNGGIYQHNNTVSIGNIPIATWQVGSACNIVGYTTIAGGIFPANNFAQAFHHFTWDCPFQTTNPNLVGLLTTVNGDFTVLSTGSGSLRLWGNATSSTLTVGGDFGVYGGTVYTNFGSANPTLNLLGRFTLDNCTFGSSGVGQTTVNFAANAQQQIDINTPTVTQTGNLAYFVRNSGGQGPSTLDFINPISEIKSDSANSSFTLESGTGMYITHVGGIAQTGNTGCIQLNTRTFDSNGDYTYIGVNQQVTGTGLPTTITGSFSIQNGTALAAGGVTLSQPTLVTGVLSIFALYGGKLITTPTTLLTLDVDCILINNPNISFVEGPLRWNTNNTFDYLFPLGEIDRYMPMAMLPQNNNAANYTCTAHYAPSNNANALSSAICSVSNVEYWDITGTAPAQIKLYWDAMSNINETALQLCNTLVVAHYDGSSNLWESKGNSGTDFNNDNVISGTYNGNFVTEAHTFGQACGLMAMATLTQPTCGNSNGEIDAMIMNGTGTYNYSWNDGFTIEDRSNMAAGTYTLYVEEAAGGCADTLSVVLTGTTAVQASITAISDASCAGNDGSASISGSGGSGTYLYSWIPTYYNTATVNTLSAGTYLVYVKDAADSTCMDTVGFTIGGGVASGVALNDTFSLCSPGIATILNVLGNDLGGLNNASLISLNSPSAAAGTLVNNGNGTFSFTLAAGFSGTATFDYEIADTSACVSSASVLINALPFSQPTISANGATTFCQGGNVILTSNALNGNLWSTGDTTQSITVTTTGNYSVTVTSGSCSATSAITAVTVSSPIPTPTITPSGASSFCQGGNVTLTSSATSGNVWNTTANTQSINVATAGTYTVTVSNAAGCTATSAPFVVTVNPLPSIPTISLNGNNIFCQGGSVNLISSYTTGNTWSNGDTSNNITVSTAGTYTVTYTNANGCAATSAPANIIVNPTPPAPVISASGPTTFCQGGNVSLSSSVATGNLWSNLATTQTINISSSGLYTVTVTDVNGCTAISAPINVIVNALPPVPVITINGNANICQGQSVSLTSSATTGNAWSSGQTTQNISTDTAGIYTLTVTENGCSSTSAPVNITVNPLPAAPTISINGNLPICAGGTITLTSSAASGNLWSNTSTNPSITVGAGTYTVTYTDANACSATSAATTVTALAPINLVTNVLADADCGAPIGSASVFASGASGNFTYSWNTNPPQLSQTATGLVAGTFTVTVFDASNIACSNSANVLISGGIAPNVSLSSSGNLTTCEDKYVPVTASGANSYIWLYNGNVVGTGAVYSVGQAGVYQVVGFSSNTNTGCSDTSAVINLTVIPNPRAEIYPIGPLEVCPETEVVLRAEALQSTSFVWLLNGQVSSYTDDTISVSANGYYSVIASNICGKDTSSALYVNIHLRPIADFIYEPIPAQAGEAVTFTDKSISAAAWSWSFGDGVGNSLPQNPLYTYNSAGVYNVTMYIDDNIGCKDTVEHEVNVFAPGSNSLGFVPNIFSPNGDGEFDEFVVQYGDVSLESLRIYDRWGDKVFETTDPAKHWNGKKKSQECAAGVYYYVIQAKNAQGNKLVEKGNVTLLR